MESENKKKFNPVPIIIIGIIGLIAIGLIIGGLILLTVLIIIPNANNKKGTSKKVLYDTKYVNEDGDIWVEFHDDGSCNRSVKGIISCEYTNLKNEITITEEQSLFGDKITMKYTFKIDDSNNLTHVKTCSPSASVGSILYCGNDATLKYKYSTKNIYKESNDTTTEDNKNTTSVSDQSMMHIEDNYYYMCLVGEDRMIFTFKEDNTFRMIYQKLKLSISSANYQTTQTIDGKYSIIGNTLYLNKATATITFGPNAGVRTQVFKYGGYDCSLVNANKSTDTGEKNKSESKKETNTNSNNVSQEDSDEQYYKATSKQILDNGEFYFNNASDHVLYISVNRIPMGNYTLTINGKKYTESTAEFQLKPGENCFNVELSDKYGQKKTESKCFNFEPVPLNYSVWSGGLAPNGTCDMHLYNEDVNYRHTYNYDQLKCTYNGQEFDCEDRSTFTANMGTSKVTIKNRYGNTQEVEFTCSR